MAAKRSAQVEVRPSWVYSPRLHVVLYSLLLIATPFVLLQNFLVEAISAASGSTFPLAGVRLPIVPVAALVVALALLVYLRPYLTPMRLIAAAVAVLWLALAQQITDYYFDHNFYDLQQNWHYIAYGIFAFMLYRDLAPRGMSLARIMLVTYLCALSFSTFDEIFQMYMSSRVFDVSDIAKDVWGTLAGVILIYLGSRPASALRADWRHLRHRRVGEYLRHPLSLLLLLMVFTLLLLCCSSLLSDAEHWPLVAAFTLVGFAAFSTSFHLSRYRWIKYGIYLFLVAGLATQSYFFLKYRSQNIVHNQYALTIYKGIPIVFFDVMIFPDGSFRLVDKKHYFNSRDQRFFLKHKPDILLIGSGSEGRGGNGFFLKAPNQFVFNPFTRRGTQVIILKTPEACEVFNRLKREGKNVLFILHNTC
jgi:VanZ family protein